MRSHADVIGQASALLQLATEATADGGTVVIRAGDGSEQRVRLKGDCPFRVGTVSERRDSTVCHCYRMRKLG